LFFWVFVIATFAGIHRGDKHKIGGILNSSSDSGDDDGFVFQWLAEDFQGFSGKFGKLIKK